MTGILANRTFRHLFTAQVIALAGTGLMTVGLALLAFDLAGERAGLVLGTALAIKMICYVAIAPVAGAFAARLPRRAFLVGLDVVRALVAVALPFIDQIWQVYVLIAVLQSASAAFTPTFQATIPDILSDETDYTRALSLSRLAYDLENLLSPALAAAIVSVAGFHWLFGGTVIGFLASALLIVTVALPAARTDGRPAWRGITNGMRLFAETPRLRALIGLNLAVAAAGAMVIVNTVVLVRDRFGLGDADVALAMAAFGGGSMLAALAIPRLLERATERALMLPAALSMALVLWLYAGGLLFGTGAAFSGLLVAWALLGIGSSAAQVPIGRLLRRSASSEDRPAVYAAQFSLSHACWLVTYPLAGWLGLTFGMPVALIVLGSLAVAGVAAAAVLWPSPDPDILEHDHPELPADHPHLAGTGRHHAHAYVIDDLHAHWPAPHR